MTDKLGGEIGVLPYRKQEKIYPFCKLEGTLFAILRNLFVTPLWVALKMGHKNILCSLEPKSKSTFIQFFTCDCLNHSRYIFRSYILLNRRTLQVISARQKIEYPRFRKIRRVFFFKECILTMLNCYYSFSLSGPLYVVVEFAPNGNLRQFLRKRRPTREIPTTLTALRDRRPVRENGSTLTHMDLVSFSYQVCRGMEYLSSKKVCVKMWYFSDDCRNK